MFKKIAITIAAFATAIFALNTFLHGDSITFLVQETYNGIVFYRIDIHQYLQNLVIAFNEVPNDLALEMPSFTWTDNVIDNLKVIVNVLIFIVNLFIWVFKLPALTIKEILALFGFVVSQTSIVNGEAVTTNWWLYDVINNILSWSISYI